MNSTRIIQGIWLVILYFFLTYVGTSALSTLSLDYQIATVSAANDPGHIIRCRQFPGANREGQRRLRLPFQYGGVPVDP